MRTQQNDSEWTFTGRHMLALMVAFFGIIFIANGAMVYFASKSWTGLVVKNSYVASQGFNKRADVQRQLLHDGWRGALSIGKDKFDFRVFQKDQPLEGCTVSGLLQRPVHNRADRTLSFAASGKGVYSARIVLAPGKWSLRLTTLCPNETRAFQQQYRFVVSPG